MHYEGLLRVPMIVSGPGVPEGKIVDDPVSTLDLAPTFFDYSGAEPLLNQHGATLRPLIETDTAVREFALNEWDLLPARTGVRLSLQTVRTKTDKLTVDLISGEGEMYDLATDPHELVNVFHDPAYSERRRVLEAMLSTRPQDMRGEQLPVGMA